MGTPATYNRPSTPGYRDEWERRLLAKLHSGLGDLLVHSGKLLSKDP